MLGKIQNPNKLNKILEELNLLFKSNRLSDIPQRIMLCKEALEIVSRETYPGFWAMLQDDLASSLVENLEGSRSKNLEQAIYHFQQALEVRTRAEYPSEWAATQHNLAGAYRFRIKGNRADNIEYAIDLYEQALEVRTRDIDAKRWAMTQFNLAGTYYKRIFGERAENLEQAIQHCKNALDVFTQETFPHNWAQVQNALGEIYRVRIRGSRQENIEESIRCFECALSVHTCEQFPDDWAMIQNNLAAAYTDRILGERTDNLERAIRCANEALKVRTRTSSSDRWSTTQLNLGNAYRHRIHGDTAENIEQAIQHYKLALEVRTFETFPEQWADIQANLGNVFLGRIHGEDKDNANTAIEYLQQAFNVYTFEAFPESWAQTQHNLGNAYLMLSSHELTEQEKQAENIEKAIECYEQALQVRTLDAFPKEWAETNNNLAGAYTKRILGTTEENIEQAIECLQLAIKVYTRKAFPRDWAGVQHNLAIAYTDRMRGDRAENIEQAIQHYQRALQEYTYQALPDNCLKTARALGNLAFEEQRWELAREAYETAFDSQDLLMESSFSRAGKQLELGQVQNLPARAAYACVQSDDVERAVEMMERRRAQLLRESLERKRQDLEQLRNMGFGDLYQTYMKAMEVHNTLLQIGMSQNGHSEVWMSQMERAVERVQTATSAIQIIAGKRHPEYRYFLKALPFDEIQKLGRDKPLAYLSATPAGGLGLVVSGKDVHSLDLPDLKQTSLLKMIWSPSDKEIDRINANLQKGKITKEDIHAVSGGYFSTYALWSLTRYLTRTSEDLKQELAVAWKKILEETTRWLWEVAMGKLVAVLKGYSESITLIPAGHLALLPLHAAWIEDSGIPAKRHYALDELNITYAPSAHALWRANLGISRPVESLLAIENPDGKLPGASDEVVTALGLFKHTKRLQGKDATVIAVKKNMRVADVLHFATHGHAGWQKEDQAQLKLADGFLALPDIFELHLQKTRLAVLSACETGVPSLKLIDEMIGLPVGMMQAGVPGVIGSLWIVDDKSTAELMKRFYKLWREDGLDPSEALRQAQIWVRNTLIQSPYHWAAFMYSGV